MIDLGSPASKAPPPTKGAMPPQAASHSQIFWVDLVIELVSRDMKALYKRSVLGILWALVTPLMQLAVFSFFFHSVLSMQIDRYASYAFTGVLVWAWFQNSLVHGARSIVGSRGL